MPRRVLVLMTHKLRIILGPTAVGKTDYSIMEALEYGSPVISCDSRQIYREMSVGTAVPSDEQLSAVKHYFIRTHHVSDLYSAGRYETEALSLVEHLFSMGHETLVMSGGSGFYIDAFCRGLDAFPPADMELRRTLNRRLEEEGVESLRFELRRLDPESYASMDIANGQRILRALEVCLSTGRPFSSYKTAVTKKRGFEIEKIGLSRPREELYGRIDRRVLDMMDHGLVDEVRGLSRYRELPALQTVGYKEIFSYLDGRIPLEEAVRLIQRNTRHYARKQMSYWRRDPDIMWLGLSEGSAENPGDGTPVPADPVQ